MAREKIGQKLAALAAHQAHLEVYWLPPYCPSLNLIERLWGHLKRTVLANVLYSSLDDLVRVFRTGVRRVSGHRSRSPADLKEPARHFLLGANFRERAVLGRVEIDG